MATPSYIEINRNSWNARTDIHVGSAFYNVEAFLAGKSSLTEIELDLLRDVKGKSILHLQCHFGMDTISLARMGARVTGADLSDNAIKKANELAEKTGADTRFICCDLYDLPQHLNEQFDIVFTSYGTIGWLPDINQWAAIIAKYLKPGGQFVFVEFHPVVWMFDEDFTKIAYNYFKADPIVETETGSYADRSAPVAIESVSWNHALGEVLAALIHNGITITSFEEFNYSPFNCFRHTNEFEPGKFRIAHLEDKLPMVYALKGELPPLTT